MKKQVLALYIMALTACGGGGGSGPAPITTPTQPPTTTTTTTVMPMAVAKISWEGELATNGSTVPLSGSGSSNAELYFWTLVSKPAGSTADLSALRASTTSITTDRPGEYKISLVVANTGNTSPPVFVTVKSATPIGGVYLTDTTLSKVESPYVITKTVQSGFNATLLIERGVEVYGSRNFASLEIFGNLRIEGDHTELVSLHSVIITSNSKSQEHSSSLNISYTKLQGNSIVYVADGTYFSLALVNSVVKDSSVQVRTPFYSSILEKNIFVDSSLTITDQNPQTKIYLTNNVFYKKDVKPMYVSISGVSNASQLVVKFNSFINNPVLHLWIPLAYSPKTVDASDNYFGTVDITLIDSMIFDRADDLKNGGYINYNPFLTEPDVNTPDVTPYLQ